MHHVVHEQSIYNEVRTLALNENGLFTVDSRVSAPRHPFRDVNVIIGQPVWFHRCLRGARGHDLPVSVLATDQADEYISRHLPCFHRGMLAAYQFSITGNRVPLRLLPIVVLLAFQNWGIKVRSTEVFTLDLLVPSYAHTCFPFQESPVVFLVFKPSQGVENSDTA